MKFFQHLFCIALKPLSQTIAKSGYGYEYQSETIISHHFYMEDIKLYVRNEQDISSLIQFIRTHIKYIGMSFGLNKCGRMVSKKGKVITTEGNISNVQYSYKYLRFQQANCNHDEATRNSVTTKYLERIKQVLKIELNVKN